MSDDKELIEVLMEMVNQHFIHENGVLRHDYSSTNELAIELLVRKGYAIWVDSGRGCKLLWEKLSE